VLTVSHLKPEPTGESANVSVLHIAAAPQGVLPPSQCLNWGTSSTHRLLRLQHT